MRHVFPTIKSDENGFSLVEIALALLIVGIVTSSVLSSIQGYRHQEAIRTTKIHQERIARALALYALHHQYMLPCPAGHSSPEEYGIAAENPRDGCHIQEGIVPFRTLGLPEKIAKDGFHHYFTYIVNQGFTTPMPSPSSPNFGYLAINNLQIQDKHQNEVTLTHNASYNEAIAFILISHGTYGHGAFTNARTDKRLWVISASQPEQANINVMPSHGVFTYYDYPYNLKGTQRFDQFVFWYSFGELMGFYGDTVLKAASSSASMPPPSTPPSPVESPSLSWDTWEQMVQPTSRESPDE